MNPLFTQNWKLFAPNPVSKNNTFFVRSKFSDGEETDWIDITSHMIDQNFKNRFSPYNRLVRIQRGVFNSLFDKDDVTVKIMEKIDRDELDEDDFREILESDEQIKVATELLNRYAQAYIGELYTNKDIQETQVLIQETDSIPYSKQNVKNYDNKKQVYKFNWEDYKEVSSIFK